MLDYWILPVKQLFSIVIFSALWHVAVFLVGTRCNEKMFDEHKWRYQPFFWEQDGKWYQRRLKIKSWKDRLPQRITEDGFSKEHLDGASVDYLNRFILETCRGEWIHFSNALLSIVLLLFAPQPFKILCAVIVLLIHLPYVAIQRYNRFRLIRCRNRAARQATALQEAAV